MSLSYFEKGHLGRWCPWMTAVFNGFGTLEGGRDGVREQVCVNVPRRYSATFISRTDSGNVMLSSHHSNSCCCMPLEYLLVLSLKCPVTSIGPLLSLPVLAEPVDMQV